MTPSELHQARAAYVRSLLAWHGKRQSDLAGILGGSQQNASQKLAGKRRFTTDDLLAIAGALDVEPRYLLEVPIYERGLLTCTFCSFPQVRGYDRTGLSGLGTPRGATPRWARIDNGIVTLRLAA